MKEIIDIYTDKTGAILGLLNEIKPLPDFVKKAELYAKDEVGSDHLFAYPEKRKFPIYDSASTYTSMGYFLLTKHNMSPQEAQYVQKNLVKAAAYWGIQREIKDLVDKVTNYIKKTNAITKAPNYALPEKKAYYIEHPTDVYEAETRFEKEAQQYPLAERIKIAKHIFNKALNFGVPVKARVVIKLAAVKPIVDPLKASTNIMARAVVLPNNNLLRQVFVKLASAITELPKEIHSQSEPPESLIKVAETLEKLDKIHNLDRHYGKYFLDPVNSIFMTKIGSDYSPMEIRRIRIYQSLPGFDSDNPFKIIKEAMEGIAPNETVLIANNPFPLGVLMQIPLEFWEGVLGEDFVEAITGPQGNIDGEQLKNALRILPLEEQRVLLSQLHKYIATRPDLEED